MRKAEPLSAAANLASMRAGHDPVVSARSLLADLLALRELQASLSLEESDETIVRVGTNAIVEILTLDGGLVFVDGFGGRPEIRFGWRHGRSMPSREIESLARALARELADVRAGRCGNLLLAARTGTGAPAATAPAAFRDLGFDAVLILGLGSGGRRSGVLVLASRDQEAFSGEQMILAEILASQVSEQCERVRLQEAVESIAPREREAAERATRGLAARIATLEAQAAIASAASPSIDAARQVEMVLKQAMEAARHSGGAVYLVETNEAGDDLLRFASGQGDAGWLERARLPRWRRGEGLPGSVWETGRGAAIDDLATDDAGLDGAAMRHAGYRRASCEPLRTRGRVIGVLLLLSDAARPYEDAERELLRGLAEQAGTAIDNARVLGDVMRHSLDLEWQIARLSTERARSARDRCLLIDLAISAAGDAPPARRAEEMLERAVDLLGADAAALLSLQRAAGSLRLVAQQGLTGEAAAALRERPTGDAVLGRCLDGDPEAIVDLASLVTLQTAPWARRFGYRHVVVVACRTEGSARGVLVLGSRYAGSPGEEGRSARASVAGLLGLLLRGESESAPKEASAGPRDAAAPAAESQAPAAAPQALDLGRAADRAILAQAQQMDSLRSLAPDLALDVNNTLGAIMGHASHIRDLVPDHNPVHDKAAVIVERSKHVAALARQVLTIARGDAGGKRPIALKPLIEEVVSLLGRAFAPAITIEVRCPADLPMVQADPGKIRQALLNLAMNARDAMPEGGRLAIEGRAGHIEAMSASAVPGLVPGDYVSVVVQDNGSGMTEEVAQHVFEPFFTTKDVAQGSGLGLTVVQDIARDHQGHVTLSTAPGMGTAVRLYLPAYLRPGAGAEGGRPEESQAGRTDPAAEAPVLSALDDTSGDLGEVSIAELCVATATTLSLRENSAPDGSPAKRILVVDDEPLLRDMAAEMLRSRGYEVLLAPDGVVALEIYRQEWGRVDLVVLDMVMPRLSGLETCRRILGMDRAARILLCTGAGSDQPVQEAIREGAVGLLRKPFDMRELFAWVQKSLPL